MENLPFEGPEFKAAWDEWIQYRKERKLPGYKPTGLKRTFAGLIRDSNNNIKTAIEIIHFSIEKNWQGLFPLKQNGTYQQPHAGNKTGTSVDRTQAIRNW